MQEDDKIFKVLGDKLRNYEAEEASDADWAAFQAVYPAKEKKKRAFLWFLFPLLGISLSLFAWYTYTYLNQVSAPQIAQSNPNMLLSELKLNDSIVEKSNTVQIATSNKPQIIKNEKPIGETKEVQTQSGKQKTSNQKQYLNPNKQIPLVEEKNITITPKNEKITLLNQPDIQTGISKPASLNNQNADSEKGKTTSDLKNKVSSDRNFNLPEKKNDLSELKPDVKEEPKDTNTGNLKPVAENLSPVDTLLVPQVKNKTKAKINVSVKHIDLNANYGPGMSLYNPSFAAGNFAGFGLGIAFGIHKNWYWGTSLNYMAANKTSTFQKEVPHEYATITKIDTTLKYDITSSMIVMDMDTHYQKHLGTKMEEFSIVRKSQVLSVPIIFGYSLGNQKTEMSLFGGVQNDWLVEEYTTNNFATKATETFTNQKLLAAPLFGFGFSRKFYANWALNLGMDYRHYLSSSLDKKDYWRVQAGIRYHLK